MAAQEDHRELIVVLARLAGRLLGDQRAERRHLAPERRLTAQTVEGPVPRHRVEAARRVPRHALVGPHLHRLDERLLHDLFGQVQAGGTDDARERRHRAARRVTEEVLREALGGLRHPRGSSSSIWRISSAPGPSRAGWSFSIATTSS